MRRHIIITTVRSSTGQLESFRLKLEGIQYYFDIFSDSVSIKISYPKILITFIGKKTSLVYEKKKREKKTLTTPNNLRARSNCVALAMRALYRNGLDFWSGRSDRNVPFHLTKLFSQDRWSVYPAYKHDNQTRGGFGLVCATGMHHSAEHVDFPKFQTGIFVEWKARKVFPEKSWPG